jgi:exodeoxyribonuclease-3
MKIVTMNINGLPSAWEAGLNDYVRDLAPDVFCMQETRSDKGLSVYCLTGYEAYFCPSAQLGRSGVGVFTKIDPEVIISGLGVPGSGKEGRAMTLELEDRYLVNVYAPASGESLERLEAKVRWMQQLREFLQYLEKRKPVILCGDLNVAATQWDMPVAQRHERSAGNTDEERAGLENILADGYYDVWRMAKHDSPRGVTWAPAWMSGAAAKHNGWRLDYFLVSKKLSENFVSCEILEATEMSDHRAVMLEIK